MLYSAPLPARAAVPAPAPIQLQRDPGYSFPAFRVPE